MRKDSPELAVYSRQISDLKLCATLRPVCDGKSEFSRTAVTIRQNSRSAATIEVEFQTPQKQLRRITYELSAGAAFVKTTAGVGVQRLRVSAPCRFAVLPDFFGDDMLVDAAAIPVRAGRNFPAKTSFCRWSPAAIVS